MGVADVPSGMVTFLFTDVEASTRLWQEFPEEMAPAVERQDEIVRAAVERNDGYVFSTAGDAFAVAFERVGDAVSTARSAQQELADEAWPALEPIRVRMGLHVGEAQERGGDYFGTVVNTAARIMSAGHGGQLLCSSEVAELARPRALEGVVFRDLGVVRLRDLLEQIRVIEVTSAGFGTIFPPLRSVDSVPNNLPIVASHRIASHRIASRRQIGRDRTDPIDDVCQPVRHAHRGRWLREDPVGARGGSRGGGLVPRRRRIRRSVAGLQ
jgi:class 3 adenylate cyclase